MFHLCIQVSTIEATESNAEKIENIPENFTAKIFNYDVDEATERMHSKVNDLLKELTHDIDKMESIEECVDEELEL